MSAAGGKLTLATHWRQRSMLYGEPSRELTEAEREVLVEGGVRLNAEPEGDALAATTTQFAALVSTSLTTKEAAVRLGIPESRMRQMIARRTLYSVLLDNRRHIPAFQFAQQGGSTRETGPSRPPADGSLVGGRQEGGAVKGVPRQARGLPASVGAETNRPAKRSRHRPIPGPSYCGSDSGGRHRSCPRQPQHGVKADDDPLRRNHPRRDRGVEGVGQGDAQDRRMACLERRFDFGGQRFLGEACPTIHMSACRGAPMMRQAIGLVRAVGFGGLAFLGECRRDVGASKRPAHPRRRMRNGGGTRGIAGRCFPVRVRGQW